MEWGPRALGNRSILCDPRRADMKEILNAKIKRRESFRPFAPSILREAVSEWFEQDDDVPFMMQVFQILPARRSLIPAVCHVDGSGRLQAVHKETNPLFYLLLSTFKRASRSCSTLPSTKTNPSSAVPKKPSIVFFEPKWMFWCSAAFSWNEKVPRQTLRNDHMELLAATFTVENLVPGNFFMINAEQIKASDFQEAWRSRSSRW